MESWKETTEESKACWEQIADCWDKRMGDDGNRHSLELVFPDTERFLDARPGEKVLDTACGNGTFSRRLARLGCSVTAFDYSSELIRHAMERTGSECSIDYRVLDATKLDDLIALGQESFDKAVCNMAIHDISDISPLFNGVYRLLKPDGVFVVSTMHPCFQNKGMQKITETVEDEHGVRTLHALKIYGYISPAQYYGYAIASQPVAHLYYHRPISALLNTAFEAGFAAVGMSEPVFDPATVGKGDWTEIPAVLIAKFIKLKRR